MDRESRGTVPRWIDHVGDKLHSFLSGELKSGSPEMQHGGRS